jgi:Asp/Glu/hydantoin racemase
MRILAINPNTTEAMTRDIEGQARLYASPDTEVDAISPRWGPASIEGHLEDELAAVATLEAIAERAGEYDGAQGAHRRDRCSARVPRRFDDPGRVVTNTRRF